LNVSAKLPPEDELPLEIEVAAVKRLQESASEFVLLDCREREEYETARIEGSVLIPISEIQQSLDKLEPLREQHIVVHCHHGGRSLQVTEWLQSLGFSRVQNMIGGIDAWSQMIDPTVPRY